MTNPTCPNCRSAPMSTFYEVTKAPVHSVLLMRTRQQALDYPTGTIQLAFCRHCGFISNVAFDASLHDYSGEYEATQIYSPTFNKFNRALAQRLIDTYDLRDKTIIEIGCGHGEFLILLSELGHNKGIGFDPAYLEDRIEHPAKERITFVPDFYSEKYADMAGDFIVCKMTLEHIPDTADFLRTVRNSIGDRVGTRVFFQIPNASYVLREVAFWDIYYEHCSYFSKASLATLFLQTDFAIKNLFTDYDDQYLMIEAEATAAPVQDLESVSHWVAEVEADVAHFDSEIAQNIDRWRSALRTLARDGRKTVLWGSGSKAVAFLTTLRIFDEIEFVVDINPNKRGTFMAGTGQEIVSPAFLQEYRPDVVIIMNPVYTNEISAALAELGISPTVLTVDSPLPAPASP
jgi:2-polyprenyl-3-methyl-5-hydroxy-6-metoxy-1,4-benzoquinol methylase